MMLALQCHLQDWKERARMLSLFSLQDYVIKMRVMPEGEKNQSKQKAVLDTNGAPLERTLCWRRQRSMGIGVHARSV